MHVAVLGPGALGSLFGARLADSDAEVTLVGRPGAHLDAVRERGLRLTDPDGATRVVDVAATDDPAAAAPADVVLVTVKSYDTADALAGAGALLDGADVCTLQNGLGNAETVAEFVPADRVLAGTTSHGATREGPGAVRHAGRGRTRIGRYSAANDERVRDLAAALTRAGVDTEATDAVRDAVWEKVLVNAGINAATALARVENGALADGGPGESLLRAAVEEGAAVARAAGRDVPADVVDRARTVARETADNRSSMRQDLAAGRRTEVAALNGALAARAEEHGLAAPVNRTLADLVRLAEAGYASGSSGRGQS